MKRMIAVLLVVGCLVGEGHGQATTLTGSGDLPSVGTRAPELRFTKLLNAPAGTKATLATLRGRVVVLEFWATWCAPCVGEIPVLNGLAKSLDPKKVQFISVDDEDPAVVEAFLRRKPMDGWVGLDSTGGMFKRYGVDARPATVVIGPDGRVASNSVRPENLLRKKLLELAEGKKTEVGGKADPKVSAEMEEDTKQAFAAETGSASGTGDALFEILVTAAERAKSGEKADTHVMIMGPGKMDITDADVETLLSMGAGVVRTRLQVEGKLPEGMFNLHVNAPEVEKGELDRAIEMAVASGAGVKIEHQTKDEDALVMTALPDGNRTALKDAHGGFAFYQPERHSLRCIQATMDQIAGALESALDKPVVNETSLRGSVTTEIPLAGKDVAAAKVALAKGLGLTLTPAVRPIERVVIKAAPEEKAMSTEAGSGGF